MIIHIRRSIEDQERQKYRIRAVCFTFFDEQFRDEFPRNSRKGGGVILEGTDDSAKVNLPNLISYFPVFLFICSPDTVRFTDTLFQQISDRVQPLGLLPIYRVLMHSVSASRTCFDVVPPFLTLYPILSNPSFTSESSQDCLGHLIPRFNQKP